MSSPKTRYAFVDKLQRTLDSKKRYCRKSEKKEFSNNFMPKEFRKPFLLGPLEYEFLLECSSIYIFLMES